MRQEMMAPPYLYKIVSTEQWQESLILNQIVFSSMDTDFIHLATEEQIQSVVQKFWKEMDHIILKVDSKKLIGRLVYENNPGGANKYYHLYEGSIPLEAVSDFSVKRINREI